MSNNLTTIVYNIFMKITIVNKFSDRLKELRIEKGLSQMQLAKELDGLISASSIGFWELNKRKPTSDALIALAIYFNVSVDYLLGLED